jgi:putative molybdopterin biosynthesis protein
MGVARAVAERQATVGLGIQAAASAYGLDFVRLGEERYDLVAHAERWDDESFSALRSVVTSPRFREALVALGGYEVTQTGEETRLE